MVSIVSFIILLFVFVLHKTADSITAICFFSVLCAFFWQSWNLRIKEIRGGELTAYTVVYMFKLDRIISSLLFLLLFSFCNFRNWNVKFHLFNHYFSKCFLSFAFKLFFFFRLFSSFRFRFFFFNDLVISVCMRNSNH